MNDQCQIDNHDKKNVINLNENSESIDNISENCCWVLCH